MTTEKICIYNGGINCNARGPQCFRCGWNPPVSEKRILELRIKLGVAPK